MEHTGRMDEPEGADDSDVFRDGDSDVYRDGDSDIDSEPEPELDDDGAADRGVTHQALLDAVRADTERLREIRQWVGGAIEREASLTAYLRGEWLADRDLLLTAEAPESDAEVFDEDAPWETVARAQAARRALHHALTEEPGRD